MREQPSLRTLPVMLLLITGLYLLLHPYQGLIHDSRLYTLQALNHLHPELYGNDVFLKYGSQDNYTLFTPLYAALIPLLGVEHAASLITFVSVLALLLSAWSLARTLMPAPYAWLGLGILVIVPTYYGLRIFFAVLEGFVTPRLLAQALVLFSTTAWMRERRCLSAALLLAGLLLHPIMAFPAIILLVLLHCDLSSVRKLWPLAPIGVLATAAALAGWVPLSRWQFDAAWWPMVDRADHLLLTDWTLDDWSRTATLFTTLGIAAIRFRGVPQRLVLGLLIACVSTLLLAWIGGDLLKIALIVQGQAWRSLWLATAISALILPWAVATCWRGQMMDRCAALLLITAWVLGPTSLALWFSIPAVIAIACSGLRIPERYARHGMLGAGILLVVTILCVAWLSWSELASMNAGAGTRTWFETLRSICADGLLPAAVLIGVWYVATKPASRTATGALTLALVVSVALIASEAIKPWLMQRYPRQAYAAFDAWRTLIPPGSDVLWATQFAGGSDPMAVWLLLERPSYYSSVQANSGLFSRAAAIELQRRGKAIPLSLPTEMPVNIVFAGKAGEAPSCSDIPVRFIVTSVPIDGAQLVAAPASLPPPFDELQLRICPEPQDPTREVLLSQGLSRLPDTDESADVE